MRDTLAKIGFSNSTQSPDVGHYSDGGVSDFVISGQSFINENCHNSRSSLDIDMKHGLVTKLDKRSKKTSEKFGDDVIPANCEVMVILRFMANLEQSRIPDA